jgi:uncharacterized protein
MNVRPIAFVVIGLLAVLSCKMIDIRKPAESFLHMKDDTNTLTYDQKKEIENQIIQVEKNKAIEMLLLIIYSTGELDEIEYANKCIDEYSLGKSNGRGLVVVIAKADRVIRIQYTEEVLPDFSENDAKQIIDTYFIPHFKNERFYEGICEGILAIGMTLR